MHVFALSSGQFGVLRQLSGLNLMAHVITGHMKNILDVNFDFMFCSVIFNCFKHR